MFRVEDLHRRFHPGLGTARVTSHGVSMATGTGTWTSHPIATLCLLRFPDMLTPQATSSTSWRGSFSLVCLDLGSGGTGVGVKIYRAGLEVSGNRRLSGWAVCSFLTVLRMGLTEVWSALALGAFTA